MRDDPKLKQALIDKGVVIHSPAATLVAELDPARIEPGVEIFPGSTVLGPRTLLRAGTRIGRAGGGWFENLAAGRGVDLFGGYYQDCVLLDGVRIRGQAELRGGCLLEEGCSAAHHVGLKMSVLMPFVTLGSLVNLADALVAGGTGPADFSEVGSVFALYNFSPQHDKWPSRFGDVPRGVFLRQRRIFVGGQARIISPVVVGYGATIAAGAAVRGDVAEGRLYSEADPVLDRDYDAWVYGRLDRKLRIAVDHIAQLHALATWYRAVRLPAAQDDALQTALYREALHQIEAGIEERLRRLDALVSKLPASAAAHEVRLERGSIDSDRVDWHRERLEEHRTLIDGWPRARKLLEASLTGTAAATVDALQHLLRPGGPVTIGYLDWIRAMDAEQIDEGTRLLQALVDETVATSSLV